MSAPPVAIGPAQLEALLGRPVDSAKAEAAIQVVFDFASAYTRGHGITGTLQALPDIAAVVLHAAARLYTNPAQMESYTSGPYSSRPAVFNGWKLPELSVLDRYRKKVM